MADRPATTPKDPGSPPAAGAPDSAGRQPAHLHPAGRAPQPQDGDPLARANREFLGAMPRAGCWNSAKDRLSPHRHRKWSLGVSERPWAWLSFWLSAVRDHAGALRPIQLRSTPSCMRSGHQRHIWRGWMGIEPTWDGSHRPTNGFEDRGATVQGGPSPSAQVQSSGVSNPQLSALVRRYPPARLSSWLSRNTNLANVAPPPLSPPALSSCATRWGETSTPSPEE